MFLKESKYTYNEPYDYIVIQNDTVYWPKLTSQIPYLLLLGPSAQLFLYEPTTIPHPSPQLMF